MTVNDDVTAEEKAGAWFWGKIQAAAAKTRKEIWVGAVDFAGTAGEGLEGWAAQQSIFPHMAVQPGLSIAIFGQAGKAVAQTESGATCIHARSAQNRMADSCFTRINKALNNRPVNRVQFGIGFLRRRNCVKMSRFKSEDAYLLVFRAALVFNLKSS
ncbi:MAG TPA: hypothetical protein VMH87_04775 [Pseudomonadales bacterium]|nr:hypothetical protein [Pseudomonadales bacterium]